MQTYADDILFREPPFILGIRFFSGFVLKKDLKKEDKKDEISLEELIEKEVWMLDRLI